MPLTLDERCKKRLQEVIAVALSEFTVRWGLFVRDAGFAAGSPTLVLPEQVQALLRSWINDDPVEQFVVDLISRRVRSIAGRDLPREIPLRDLPEFREVDRVAEEIVEELAALPYLNRVVIPLPLFDVPPAESFADPPLPVGSRVMIASEAHIPTPGPRKVKDSDGEESPYFLSWQGEGFVGLVRSPRTLRVAVDNAQQTIGIAIAGGLFALSGRRYGEDSNAQVLEQVGAAWYSRPGFAVRELLDNRSLRLRNALATETDRFGVATLFFCAFSEHSAAVRIRTAAQWYLESLVAGDELTAFMRISTAIEILLGHGYELAEGGLTQLLANRCAYLIGARMTEREEILGRFRSFYQTRSRIIHEGHRLIGRTERGHLEFAQDAVNRILKEELRLVRNDLTGELVSFSRREDVQAFVHAGPRREDTAAE